jgi:hypothetical protein
MYSKNIRTYKPKQSNVVKLESFLNRIDTEKEKVANKNNK